MAAEFFGPLAGSATGGSELDHLRALLQWIRRLGIAAVTHLDSLLT